MSEQFFRTLWNWAFTSAQYWATFTPTQIDDDAAAEALKPSVVDEFVALGKKCGIIR